MKKLLLALLVIVMVILFIPAQVLADTGTYKIDNYTVTLTPQSDGSVDISYYQQWDCFIRKYSLDYSRAAEYFLYNHQQQRQHQ